MSPAGATYLDSSAIVKLVVAEAESSALRAHLEQSGRPVSSALATTEVGRSLHRHGAAFMERGADVLHRIELVRISERVLERAASLQPSELRSLDAIHLATVGQLGDDVSEIVTYDDRMAAAASALGWVVRAPI
jgi:predicted nucleic acid-binding protein